MAAVALLMAIWWITEAIPLAATSLLPLVLFPLLGILPGKATAPMYIKSTIFLFVGGFLIALAMEKWNLHRRIALSIIRLVGGGPSRLVLGFMIAAAALSMWISNTATCIMMMPIGLAVVLKMEDQFGAERSHRFAVGLMLGIAYACSMGGIATLVGTPPNLALKTIFSDTFPGAEPISFGRWMMLGVPVAIVMIASAWLVLTKVMFRLPRDLAVDQTIVEQEHRKLGPIRFEEVVVLIVFSLTAVLWVFRKDLTFSEAFALPGWSRLLPEAIAPYIDDSTVAIAMALVLFLIPSRGGKANSPTILGGEVFARVPWDIVLLFGGGFALASGFESSGLSELIGHQFAGLNKVSPLIMILVICLTLTFMTELTSNTATTQIVLPILAAVAVSIGIHPLILMVPATLSASCAFMMPVATPPNAIIFGSRRVGIAEMARAGIVLNLIGIIVVTLLFYYVGRTALGIGDGPMPDWATLGSAP